MNGDIPKQVVQQMTQQPINISLVHVYLKTDIEVPTGNQVEFRIGSRCSIWIDGQSIEPNAYDAEQGQSRFAPKLASGRHRLLIRLDARDLPERIRVEADNVVFLSD